MVLVAMKLSLSYGSGCNKAIKLKWFWLHLRSSLSTGSGCRLALHFHIVLVAVKIFTVKMFWLWLGIALSDGSGFNEAPPCQIIPLAVKLHTVIWKELTSLGPSVWKTTSLRVLIPALEPESGERVLESLLDSRERQL